jgi:hypothetical protein
MAETETAVFTLEPTKPVHRLTQEDRMKGVKARLEKAAAKKALASSQTLVSVENNGDSTIERETKIGYALALKRHSEMVSTAQSLDTDELMKGINGGKSLYGWGSKPASDRPAINIHSVQILSQLKRKD